jgi:hypothetical protein
MFIQDLTTGEKIVNPVKINLNVNHKYQLHIPVIKDTRCIWLLVNNNIITTKCIEQYYSSQTEVIIPDRIEIMDLPITANTKNVIVRQDSSYQFFTVFPDDHIQATAP